MKLYYQYIEEGADGARKHEAAYELLRGCLMAEHGIVDADIRKLPSGKPYIANNDMHISISHTEGLVCCAVSDRPIGVDCEHIRTVRKSTMLRVCTEAELRDIEAASAPEERFLMYWVLKESISKKSGVGLRSSFKDYEISFVDGKPVCAGHELSIERIGTAYFIAIAE